MGVVDSVDQSPIPQYRPDTDKTKPEQRKEEENVGSGASGSTKPPSVAATGAYGHGYPGPGYRPAKIEQRTTTVKCDVGGRVDGSVSVANLQANTDRLDSPEKEKPTLPANGPALEGAAVSGEIHGQFSFTCTRTEEVITYVEKPARRHVTPRVTPLSPSPSPSPSPPKAEAVPPPASPPPVAVVPPPASPPKDPAGSGSPSDRAPEPTDNDVRNATGYYGQLDTRDKQDWVSTNEKANEVTAKLKGKCEGLPAGKEFCKKEAGMVGTLIKIYANWRLSQGNNLTSILPP